MPQQVASSDPHKVTAAVALATVARAGVAIVGICAALAAPAQAGTSATISPSLSPDRLGARAALTFTVRYSGGEFGVPAPVRRSVMRFPAGLSLAIPDLRSCPAARLRAHGARGCPVQSRLGGGHALLEAHAGSLTIREDAALSTFLGPPHNLQPTFDVLAQGYTPLDERMVLTGSVQADRAPYGEELAMSIPPIPTLSLLPDASILTLSLTIGASSSAHAGAAATVLLPPSCPAGGFPFAGEFGYADGSSGSALATAACPR